MTRAETRRQLLALIRLNPGLSVSGLSRRSGLSARTVTLTLLTLHRAGRVRIENTPEPKHNTVAWRSYPVSA